MDLGVPREEEVEEESDAGPDAVGAGDHEDCCVSQQLPSL